MSNENLSKLANPAPLGLIAFGITTVLLNLANAGLFNVDSVILAMGIAYGGLAQVLVGIMEYRRGNTFGTVAFTSYGLFWWSLVMILVLPNLSFTSGAFGSPTSSSLAAYFLMWGIFTFAMFFGTLKVNRALQLVFGSLAVLFFMLTIGALISNTTFTMITGIEGVVCGLSAVYLAIAEILNEAYHKNVLPIGVTS